ncbi:hypothetical protein ACW5WG_12955, partial [Aeromonas salmonicida]
WSACQKAPSVTVTWGWGNHDLLADLGNNATVTCNGVGSYTELFTGSLFAGFTAFAIELAVCEGELVTHAEPHP